MIPTRRFPRGYLEDFWFYARNNHPALFCLRDPAHPYGRSDALAAELVQQAYAIWAAGAAARAEKPWTSLNNYAHNAQITVAYISVPLLILAELLWFLLACPCARFERRGRKRETVFRCTQKTLEALGHAVVLPLVLLAVGFLVLEAMRLDGSESDAPVVAWWAAGVLWSYVIWFPVKLGVQFNLVWKSNLRRVRPESPRRPPRHGRDACSMAWRCRSLTARPS